MNIKEWRDILINKNEEGYTEYDMFRDWHSYNSKMLKIAEKYMSALNFVEFKKELENLK
jgi:SRSO17 transposase